MAVLTEDDVRAIADYATIALDETELTAMTSYLNDAVAMLKPILDYAAEDVEPTFLPDGGIANVMRPDQADEGRALGIDEALSNAASARDGQFRVPSIMGDGGER